MYDLRSDTVTRPTEAMRRCMAAAEVGDDVYGEDPTVNLLEQRVADLLGFEGALFVPSGTMANQLALLCLTERGDEVVVGEGAHIYFYEVGAGAAWSGVQFCVAGQGGTFTAAELDAVVKPKNVYSPRTRVVSIENTHNRSGGRVFPQAEIERVKELGRRHGLALHLDGARIWNAAVHTGREPRELARGFDVANVCFSKGLGAPVGSALLASKDILLKAKRLRRMLGGGMRQAGVLAAAALYALEHHRARLSEDHENAAHLASVLAQVPSVRVMPTETNMVMFDVPVDAQRVVDAARARGVLLGAIGPQRLRAVTHLDLDRDTVNRAATLLAEALAEQTQTAPGRGVDPVGATR
jgi:threonine aldolase